MTSDHSARMRSYGEIPGESRWDSAIIPQPALAEQENAFYAPKFSMSITPPKQVVVYVSSFSTKAEFGMAQYGELGQQRDFSNEEVSASVSAITSARFPDNISKGNRRGTDLDTLLGGSQAKEGANTLDNIISAISGLRSFLKMGWSKGKKETEEPPNAGSADGAEVLLAYAISGKSSGKKRKQEMPSYAPQEKGKGFLYEPLVESDNAGADGILPNRKKGKDKLQVHGLYGGKLGYGIPPQDAKKGGEEQKYDFRQVWDNLDIRYAFTIGKKDIDPFSHYIDYSSIKPKTHGSTMVKGRSFYHHIRRQTSVYAALEGHFG